MRYVDKGRMIRSSTPRALLLSLGVYHYPNGLWKNWIGFNLARMSIVQFGIV